MTTALADPVQMIHVGAPRLIHSDEQLAEYTEALFRLTAKDEPTTDEMDAIDLLSVLIERYETERYPVPVASPTEVLRYLMEMHGLQQRDLIPDIGSEAGVSLLLSGKRKFTLKHITAFSRRFHVSPSTFME